MSDSDFDYAIIGSGFGGSVAALRLSQKGYRVALFEMGKRFGADDFPKSNWNSRKFIWWPKMSCYGIQKINLLRDMLILSGTGVGGGSLVYGNTLFTPQESFFQLPLIQRMGGQEGLLPYYEIAKKMLGVVDNPKLFEPDRLLQLTAAEYGREQTFHRSPVGIFFGEENVRVRDPYFMGDGPDRTGCNFCGGCFVGCRYDAKNTLDKNYLYFAEKLGTQIFAESKVIDVKPLSPDGTDGYEITSSRVTDFIRHERRIHRVSGVIFAAGVLGTLEILFKLKQNGRLPRLSKRLGCNVRSNSETILGVKSRNRKVDYSRGIAASSSVFPDEHTHIQADRYPAGSDAMGLLGTIMTDGGGKIPRPLRLLGNVFRSPLDFLRASNPFGFAKRSIILVVMQDLDNSMRIVHKRSWFPPFRRRLTTEPESGKRPPVYIPIANDFARHLARRMNGIPGSTLNEVFNIPTTAHILGGCTIGGEAEGLIDLKHRVYGYKNMLVCDGSAIPVNLGVNPALSITAFAERALSFVPVKKDLKLLNIEKKWKIEGLLLHKD